MKFEDIVQALNTSDQRPEQKLDILVLTFFTREVWDKYYDIIWYNLHRKDRLGKNGGGILGYVNENIKAVRRTDLETYWSPVAWSLSV